MYNAPVLSYSDSYMYWCLVYICEGIFDLRIYVTVTSSYPRDRGVTFYLRELGYPVIKEMVQDDFELNCKWAVYCVLLLFFFL